MKQNTKSNVDIKQLQEDSERRFQDFCDRNKYQWLYINQDKGSKFSRSLYDVNGKRPDYLVTIPNLGTVFFDVKAKLDRNFYEEYYKKSVPGFNLDSKDFRKLENLQRETTINVWYAVFPHLRNRLTGNCFVAPLNIISKFVLAKHMFDPKWMYIQIPKQCFNECFKEKGIELKVKCKACSRPLCQEFQEKTQQGYE